MYDSWTDEETLRCILLFKKGKSNQEIADRLNAEFEHPKKNRTHGAVRSRLKKYQEGNFDNLIPLEESGLARQLEIAKQTNAELRKELEKREDFIRKITTGVLDNWPRERLIEVLSKGA